MGMLNLIALRDNIPPEVIGEIRIRVRQNQTATVTVADLMSMRPNYFQEFERPLGGIQVIRYGLSIGNLINSNGSNLLATLLNDGASMKYNTSTNIVDNGKVLNSTLVANKFKIQAGSRLGEDYVEYRASSMNNNNITESPYSRLSAKLFIKVVSSTNLKPSRIGDGEVECPVGELVTIDLDYFTNTTPTYQDPENDTPLKIKILSLPLYATLTFRGIPVVLNQEIPATAITNGELKAFFPGDYTGPDDDFKFDIADTGSGQYSGL